MQAQKQLDTLLELAIAAELTDRGVMFDHNVSIDGIPRRRFDFVFHSARVALSVDSCFWHGCPAHATWPKANDVWWRAKLQANRDRDRDSDRQLSDLGWKSVRTWEHEDPAAAVDRLLALLADAG